MEKFRLNLRKVATIVVCLAVTMMFASCDNKKGDDDGGNGGGDSKLTGHWQYEYWAWSYGIQIRVIYNYYFYEDGRLVNFERYNTQKKIEGKYTFSDGKINWTDRVQYQQDNLSDQGSKNILDYGDDFLKYIFTTDPTQPEDVIMEYILSSDEDGDYMQIWDERFPETTSKNNKYRKVK